MISAKKDLSMVAKWIDYTLLSAVCVFCLKYITYSGKLFAETFFQFPFLSFPVFIGEFLLMGCVLLCVVRTSIIPVRPNRWMFVLILFLVFILMKAYLGYVNWGPLALRDAAMFYYVAFAIFCYISYRPEFFHRWTILVCYAALFWLVFDPKYNELYLMPRIFMGLVLASKFPDRRIALLMAAGVFLTTPYKYFLDTSRAIILGNFISMAFLIGVSVWMVDRKKRSRWAIAASLILLLLSVYIFYFSGNKPAQGLFAWDKLCAIYQEAYGYIEEKHGSYKPIMREESLVLFNPDEIVDENAAQQEMINESPISKPAEQALAQKDRDHNQITKDMKIGNSVFRLFIWQDARDELFSQKPVFGFEFGKPFRSKNIEIVRWGMDHWSRDGWVAMHNSYLNIIYRAGLFGFLLIAVFCGMFLHCVKTFIRLRSVAGLLICASLLVPLTVANFSVTLELPYTAIPIWSLFGLMLAFANSQTMKQKRVSTS